MRGSTAGMKVAPAAAPSAAADHEAAADPHTVLFLWLLLQLLHYGGISKLLPIELPRPH